MAYMNACSSQNVGYSDKAFETAVLGCTLHDQKMIKDKLQKLSDSIDQMSFY